MKYSLNLIGQFTPLHFKDENEFEAFLEKMAIDGFETEGVEHFDLDTNVIVARIDSVKKHPNADKLNLCEVHVGKNKYQIVCGAKNVYPDMLVALAQVGSELPNGLKITKSKIRDIVSEGMLCSASELGLAEKSDGIMDLAKETFHHKEIKEGVSLRDLLAYPERVVDFNITPDRGYALSHFALAQEIAILNQQKCIQPLPKAIAVADSELKLKPEVESNAGEACPRYLLRSIRGINNQIATPAYISSRLLQTGINCVNPVVDILNYVMIECGQPMHAFDAKQISGEIQVRFAKANEGKIKLINQDEVAIQAGTLLICDENKPVAIAGVMGSLDSAVQSESVDILLEAAYFDAKTIAGKARDYHLNSDAAYRYERGVDFNLPEFAMARASELILKHLGGKASAIFVAEAKASLPQLKPITLEFNKVNQVLGLNLMPVDVIEMLSRIADVKYTSENLTLTPPSHRFDLRIPEDLIEEVIRIYGYQKLESNHLKVAAKQNRAQQFNQRRIRDYFADKGYSEVINYSFISPEYHSLLHPNIEPIKLDNPISQDKSVMRYSLIAGLLENYKQNKKYKNEINHFFEIGTCFEFKEGAYIEKMEIAGLLAGSKYQRGWTNTKREVDYYDLKGDLENLFDLAGIQVQYENTAIVSCFHPNQSARLTLNGKTIGFAGFMHPELLKQLEIEEPLLLFEFMLDAVIDKPAMRFQAFSRFPAVKRDLAFLVSAEVTAAQIYQVIASLKIPDLLSYDIFDVYQDKKMSEKSIAIEFCFQSSEKTLTDPEIDAMLQIIIEKLTSDLSVKFRDIE